MMMNMLTGYGRRVGAIGRGFLRWMLLKSMKFYLHRGIVKGDDHFKVVYIHVAREGVVSKTVMVRILNAGLVINFIFLLIFGFSLFCR